MDEAKEVEVVLETGLYDPRKHGHAYVAILRCKNGKLEREFVKRAATVRGRKGYHYIAVWRFKARVGEVLEARINPGSWRNEYRDYFLVTENGLVSLSRKRAIRIALGLEKWNPEKA